MAGTDGKLLGQMSDDNLNNLGKCANENDLKNR